ncbi:MAG: large-conductance mechanosensitive channel protein MscL [Clostridia bacterium]|nr:large-conductance mechanosensitive channel protein MscL [Clostridia bacterium]
MKAFDEFKKFISRGNVMDLAVGVIMGTAFTKIVTSLVENIITPVLSVITGKVNIADLSAKVTDDLVIPYGQFLQAIIDFLLISISVFAIVKLINKIREKFEKKEEEEAAPPAPTKEEELLTEIRDILKNK